MSINPLPNKPSNLFLREFLMIPDQRSSKGSESSGDEEGSILSIYFYFHYVAELSISCSQQKNYSESPILNQKYSRLLRQSKAWSRLFISPAAPLDYGEASRGC
jgi:hypothetical protein